MIRRASYRELLKRLKENRRFVQVLAGPRQVGRRCFAGYSSLVALTPAKSSLIKR
jgi:predicted AAA+ superfamily ATPase